MWRSSARPAWAVSRCFGTSCLGSSRRRRKVQDAAVEPAGCAGTDADWPGPLAAERTGRQDRALGPQRLRSGAEPDAAMGRACCFCGQRGLCLCAVRSALRRTGLGDQGSRGSGTGHGSKILLASAVSHGDRPSCPRSRGCPRAGEARHAPLWYAQAPWGTARRWFATTEVLAACSRYGARGCGTGRPVRPEPETAGLAPVYRLIGLMPQGGKALCRAHLPLEGGRERGWAACAASRGG